MQLVKYEQTLRGYQHLRKFRYTCLRSTWWQLCVLEGYIVHQENPLLSQVRLFSLLLLLTLYICTDIVDAVAFLFVILLTDSFPHIKLGYFFFSVFPLLANNSHMNDRPIEAISYVLHGSLAPIH